MFVSFLLQGYEKSCIWLSARTFQAKREALIYMTNAEILQQKVLDSVTRKLIFWLPAYIMQICMQ